LLWSEVVHTQTNHKRTNKKKQHITAYTIKQLTTKNTQIAQPARQHKNKIGDGTTFLFLCICGQKRRKKQRVRTVNTYCIAKKTCRVRGDMSNRREPTCTKMNRSFRFDRQQSYKANSPVITFFALELTTSSNSARFAGTEIGFANNEQNDKHKS